MFELCFNEMGSRIFRNDFTSESFGDQVATVTKKWGGFCKEAVLDADNFQIDFFAGKNVTIEEKILILATTFLIDLMYYENDG